MSSMQCNGTDICKHTLTSTQLLQQVHVPGAQLWRWWRGWWQCCMPCSTKENFVATTLPSSTCSTQHVHVRSVTCHSTASKSKQPNLPLNNADCQIAAALVASAHGHHLRKALFGFPGWCFAVVVLILQAAASSSKAGCNIAYVDMAGAQVCRCETWFDISKVMYTHISSHHAICQTAT